jgi:hypothetical protein
MSRILFERLDRRTGWFESDAATHFGIGINQGRHGSQIGNGLIRAVEGGNGEPVWVKYAWNAIGVMRPPEGGLDHWQVTLNEAARWFSLNLLEPPDPLIDDLASSRDSVQAPDAPQTSENEPSTPVPPFKQLTELRRALQKFITQNPYSAGSTWRQEDDVLPLFTGVADAL